MTHSSVWRDSYICRVANTHRMPYLYMSFSAKEPCIQWLFCEKRSVTQGILCMYATLHLTHLYVQHDSLIFLIEEPSSMPGMSDRTWLIRLCDTTHAYVRHDSFICAKWLIHMCDMTHSLCDMTHSYVRHDSFIVRHDSSICATWLIHMCDMTHSCVRHDSFICATWLIHRWDVTH